MSHLATVKTEIRDIEAVKRACAELGLTFHEGKQSYAMMDEVKNEQGKATGFKAVQNPCSHAISHPKWISCNIPLEVGLVKTATGYALHFDENLQGTHRFWAHQFEITIGANACRLMQLYGVHKATIEAKRLGHMVHRTPGKNGAVKLVVTGQF